MNSDTDTDNLDPLDSLLATAAWERPIDHSMEQLRAVYLTARRRQTRMVLVGRLAVAAGIILAAGAGIFWRQSQGPEPVTRGQQAWRPEARDPYVRAPTLAERAILLRPEMAAKPGPTLARVRERVDAAIVAVMASPESAAEQAAELGQLRRPDWVEKRLLETTADRRTSRRIARATLLAERGSARALELAVTLLQSPQTRETGLALAGRLADNAALVQIASGERAEVQRALLGTLLQRGTPEAIGQYLDCVAHTPMAEAALAMATPGTSNGIVDVLVERLADRDTAISIAAARTLGRIDGPELTERLAKMIPDRAKQRQAILALLCMATPRAQGVLAAAGSRQSVAWAIRSVERQLDRCQ